MGILEIEQIKAVHTALVSAGRIDRDALCSGINAEIVNALTRSNEPIAQLLMDLQALNTQGRQKNGNKDGDYPLAIYLSNALMLTLAIPQAQAILAGAIERCNQAAFLPRPPGDTDAPDIPVAPHLPVAPDTTGPAEPPKRRRFERHAPAALAILALVAGIGGRVARAPPRPVIDIEITADTEARWPAQPNQPKFSDYPVPLERVAEVLDRLSAGSPRAVALAIELGSDGRRQEEIDALSRAIARARDRAVRVIVPQGAARALVDAAGGAVGEHALLLGSILLGQTLTGVPTSDPAPLSLQLVAAEPPAFATEAVLPLNEGQCGNTVQSVDAGLIAADGDARLREAYVVLGGSIAEWRQQQEQGRVHLYVPPLGRESITTSRAHAMVAACAAGGGLRWALPAWPWLAAGVGALAARARKAKRLSAAILVGIGVAAVVVTTSAGYTVPVWPLLVVAAASAAMQRLKGGDDDVSGDGRGGDAAVVPHGRLGRR
ncbi:MULTISPECIES: hypothetical protein [Sorangium]|uniref:Effector-associated domain-containing protein n=1 Tax=Sorangium cellulosum TaxID=56 RepID=A0A4P2QTB3_SORCE|nr:MULTISPECIES: hypothetical protein [Sorangium]AUX33520.1 uncharacterized protein SOCE836_056800 [Sorangium cellulosum]WCQ92836.1 hypothetical protein NQZ70_05582 [Sorangium sp. Soce836]